MNKKDDLFILSAARTPIGRLQGQLHTATASDLGVTAVRAAVERANLPNLADIDEVYMGNVVSAGLGQNIARQIAIRSGLPHSVGATTINKVCGASLKTVMLAAQAIRAGDGDLFVAGGVESMSNAPHLVNGRSNQLRYGNSEMRDALVVDGLWCAFENWAMGNAAEYIADNYDVTRAAMDEYALASHQKAIAAMDNGRFTAEIIPVTVTDRKGKVTTVAQDEAPRRNTSLDALAGLQPVFKENGRVTAGNAPSLNDAAAALIIASQAKVEELDAAPLARIVGYAQKAVAPIDIFDAPAQAIAQLLKKLDWSLEDVDLFEVNEAFAAQILANGYALRADGWAWDKVNVNGGAIALGHPLGATGSRMLTTLLYALKARRLQRGIASLCMGGGEAIALAVEMIG